MDIFEEEVNFYDLGEDVLRNLRAEEGFIMEEVEEECHVLHNSNSQGKKENLFEGVLKDETDPIENISQLIMIGQTNSSSV